MLQRKVWESIIYIKKETNPGLRIFQNLWLCLDISKHWCLQCHHHISSICRVNNQSSQTIENGAWLSWKNCGWVLKICYLLSFTILDTYLFSFVWPTITTSISVFLLFSVVFITKQFIMSTISLSIWSTRCTTTEGSSSDTMSTSFFIRNLIIPVDFKLTYLETLTLSTFCWNLCAAASNLSAADFNEPVRNSKTKLSTRYSFFSPHCKCTSWEAEVLAGLYGFFDCLFIECLLVMYGFVYFHDDGNNNDSLIHSLTDWVHYNSRCW